MHKESPLSFRVHCADCYGTEVWSLERVVRSLTSAGILPPLADHDPKFIAEQFIANHKKIVCPGCGKTNVLQVQLIVPKT